ncbi:MAG: hypothetical protein JWQ40_458 [Segetibacter sp.]|nr:hypothetical protein [Segetibacter sp.]
MGDIAKYVNGVVGRGASEKGAHAPGETIKLKEFQYSFNGRSFYFSVNKRVKETLI